MKGIVKPDLKFDHTSPRQHVEFSFSLPFYDLFYERWDAVNLVKSGKEFQALCDRLNIEVDFEYVESEFWQEDNHDVLVFHNQSDPNIFIYFDIAKYPTDQCGMIDFAVRVRREDEVDSMQLLLELYRKSQPRSAFQLDYTNSRYYRLVFLSSFYFYGQSRSQYDEKQNVIRHYGLDSGVSV